MSDYIQFYATNLGEIFKFKQTRQMGRYQLNLTITQMVKHQNYLVVGGNSNLIQILNFELQPQKTVDLSLYYNDGDYVNQTNDPMVLSIQSICDQNLIYVQKQDSILKVDLLKNQGQITNRNINVYRITDSQVCQNYKNYLFCSTKFKSLLKISFKNYFASSFILF